MFKSINNFFEICGPFRPLSGWFIRLPWGATFLYHGVTKFTNGIDGFAGMLSGFGAAAYPLAVLVAIAEVLAGLGAIVGGFTKDDFGDAVTKLAGLAAFPVMIGALVLVRFPGDGGWRGMEFDVLLLGVAIYLILKGKDL